MANTRRKMSARRGRGKGAKVPCQPPPRVHFKKQWLAKALQERVKEEPEVSQEYVELDHYGQCGSTGHANAYNIRPPVLSRGSVIQTIRPVQPVRPVQPARPISEIVQAFSPHTPCEVGTAGWRKAIAGAASTYHELIRSRDTQMDTRLDGTEDAVDLSHYNRLRMLYTIKWINLKKALAEKYAK
jgi:hypothetical protein